MNTELETIETRERIADFWLNLLDADSRAFDVVSECAVWGLRRLGYTVTEPEGRSEELLERYAKLPPIIMIAAPCTPLSWEDLSLKVLALQKQRVAQLSEEIKGMKNYDALFRMISERLPKDA